MQLQAFGSAVLGLIVLPLSIIWWVRRQQVVVQALPQTRRQEIIHRVLAAVRSRLYLDTSREDFLQDAAETMADLTMGALVGRDRYKRLLLGPKGVGKTTLLRSLQEAAKAILGRHGLFCVYLDYSNVRAAPMPVEALIGGLSFWHRLWLKARLLLAPQHSHVSIAEAFLLERRLKAFVVIDELQHVYGASCRGGVAIVDQLCQLGASQAGAVHWILTGSSSSLLDLVAGELHFPQPDWPNYMKQDLNTTKFVPISIQPLLKARD